MQENNLCQKNQELNEFVCTNQLCENGGLLLCKQCLKMEHYICRKQNQIMIIEKYSHKIISQLDETIREEEDLLNKLNQSKKSIFYYLLLFMVINQSRKDSTMIKQKAKLLVELKASNLFKEIKEHNSINDNYFIVNKMIFEFGQSLNELENNLGSTISKILDLIIKLHKTFEKILFSKEIQKIDTSPKSQQHLNEEQVNKTLNLPNHQLYQITNNQETARQKVLVKSQYQKLLEQQIQIQPQNSSNKNKLQLKQQFGREVSENSIEIIMVIKQKQWIAYSEQDKMIYFYDLQNPKKLDLKKFSVKNSIIDLDIDNKKTQQYHQENLHFIQYSDGSTQKILTSKYNIIQIAAYVEILVLQQNNKVYKYVMNGNIKMKKQARITGVTTIKYYAEKDQPQFFIGFKNGKLNCYEIN